MPQFFGVHTSAPVRTWARRWHNLSDPEATGDKTTRMINAKKESGGGWGRMGSRLTQFCLRNSSRRQKVASLIRKKTH